MIYIRVLWKHENQEYPVTMYSELDEGRYEVRKVELFHDGSLCYACDGGSTGATELGEVPLPSIQEIAVEDEFEPMEISKAEFEEVWVEAGGGKS